MIVDLGKSHSYTHTYIMPELTTNENVPPPTTDQTYKSPQQLDLEEAETALAAKDYKSARDLLEKLGNYLSLLILQFEMISVIVIYVVVKVDVSGDDEEPARIKESAILALGRVFKETKDAKCKRKQTHDEYCIDMMMLDVDSIGIFDQKYSSISWSCESSKSSQTCSNSC